MSWRKELGEGGERAVTLELERRKWAVTDLNATREEPNVDLVAKKDGRTVKLQVKTYNDYGWIFGGGVNPAVCRGELPLFNRASGAEHQCTHVVCLTPAAPGDKKVIRDDWRYFIMPVAEAERIFRINVDAYYNTPKVDGTFKKQQGTFGDFVGPPPINSNVVPDHHKDYAPYENAWEVLER